MTCSPSGLKNEVNSEPMDEINVKTIPENNLQVGKPLPFYNKIHTYFTDKYEEAEIDSVKL